MSNFNLYLHPINLFTMKITTTILSVIATSVIGIAVNAQCSSITCPSPMTVNNDPNICSADVGYSVPVGLDVCSSGSVTYAYTGAVDTFVVPAGVTSINVDVYGAQGGANWINNDNYGGRVQADVTVTPGQMVFIYVGQQPNGIVGGWNGGGNGETGGQGGGGASDIRIGGQTYNDRIVVAGGAGGAGYWNSTHVVGGYGGGLTGGPGYRGTTATEGGDPGTQTSSGDGTCVSFNNPICAGGFGYGGSPSGCGCEGYGGGGGWYGGAGSGNCRGGGGGSGYADAALTSNVTMTDGVRMGHGEITISYYSPLPTYLISGLGNGSTFPVGTTTETYMTTNGVDTAMCSFDITVIDNEAPVVMCPLDVSTCDPLVTGIEPTSGDNCGPPAITYYTYGATILTGTSDASSNTFNVGTTMVTYVATDASGKTDSCTFMVNIDPPLPVSLSGFADSMICVYDSAVALPIGTPAGGTYSGSGISGNTFDPSLSGTGSFYVTYSYTDTSGCSGIDSTMIIVDQCLSINEPEDWSHIQLFPNPTSDEITITISGYASEVSYEVYAPDGRLVMSETRKIHEKLLIDLKDKSPGAYVLKLSLGDKQKSYKIIKE